MVAGASRGKTQESKSLLSALGNELPFKFLEEITDGFSRERQIHQNCWGAVYRGILIDGTEIVVKRIDPQHSTLLDEVVQNEVTDFMGIQHKNILELVGYCNEIQKVVLEHNGRYILADTEKCLFCYKCTAKGSLDKHVFEESCTIDWDTRFKIIKGICQGLHFLHKETGRPIIHMDLNPANILLDNNMVPKLWCSLLSRRFSREQTRMVTENVIGSHGYIAPEYLYRGEISAKADIYSLGVLILEIATGERSYQSRDDMSSKIFIEKVRKQWTGEHISSRYSFLSSSCLLEVKICVETGLKCVEVDRKDRPSIADVINILNGRRAYLKQTVNTPKFHLGVKPQRLCFPFERNKTISCPLQLYNNGDDRIAFMLEAPSTTGLYMTKLPLCGTVPQRCTYTLTVTMRKQARPPSDSGEFFTLQSVVVDEHDLQNVEQGSVAVQYHKFFKKAKDGIQEVTLLVVRDPPAEGTTLKEKPTRSNVEIINTTNALQVSSIDVHAAEPWIMTTHKGGILRVWNYQTMVCLDPFNAVSQDVSIYVAKFIEREKWLVAGDGNGDIHVCSYNQHEKINSFNAHDSPIKSLAVHPTLPFLLSSSDDSRIIKLWDWDQGWKCTRTFQGHTASVTQIWNVQSDDDNTTITLKGPVKELLCVNYFTRHNRHHLITCSDDETAQIWDLGKHAAGCVEKLEGNAELTSAVFGYPELPVLITGSSDGTVRLLNSDTYTLESIMCFNLGAVYAFGFIKNLRRY